MADHFPDNLINLFSNENTYLIPSRVTPEIGLKLLDFWKTRPLEKHVFITSSGTTSSNNIKSYAISYDALKNNAIEVNKLIKANASDRWLSSLPLYHIGGLSIYVRAKLSGSEVISYNEKWDPIKFVKILEEKNIQFCSIVPTQLFDIVENNLRPWKNLKGVFVGGDYTASILYNKAMELGWPLFVTFGMTEVSSQLATIGPGEYKDDFLKVLKIHQVKIINGLLGIKSISLYTESYQLADDTFKVLKPELIDGYFITNDKVILTTKIEETYIKPMGRVGEDVKINGRLYNLLPLKNNFSNITHELGLFNKVEMVITDDQRSGKCIELWIENSVKHKVNDLIEKLSSDMKISNLKYFEKLPRNNLGKLIRNL